MNGSAVDRTRALLRRTRDRAPAEEVAALRTLDELFDEPARIAIAGMVKAGKSTLLNALVGERVAPTDAGECTRIPTWYRRGRHYEVRAIDPSGSEGSELGFSRRDELVVDLANRDPASVDHLLVSCPSNRLGHQTLIDLPGHSSLSADVARRAEEFLVADDGAPVDAVLYLLRHRHPADLEFIEAFHGASGGRGAVGGIGVLSRADEVFGGRLDAMEEAGRVADVLRADERLRGLCQDVVPVAGLLAESAASLRNEEVTTLRAVSALPDPDVEWAIGSVDRFRTLDHAGSTADQRVALLERLGLYGVRLSIGVLQRDPGRSVDGLAGDLLQRSGIGVLRSRLQTVVHERVGDLRARVVLARLAASPTLRQDPVAVSEWERIEANAHGVRELEAAATLRRGRVPGLTGETGLHLQRLLGVFGVSASARLGAPSGAGADELRSRAAEEHRRWTELSESPLAAPVTVQLSSIGVRTCEALLSSELTGHGDV